MASKHLLAVEIEADGSDVHAYLKWSPMWSMADIPTKYAMMTAFQDALGDAIEDLQAQARADLVRKVSEKLGVDREEALAMIVASEFALEAYFDGMGSDGVDWDEEDF